MNEKTRNSVLLGEIINNCWEDDEFARRFREQPEQVLKEAGLELKEGATYHVVDQTSSHMYAVIPEGLPKEQQEAIVEQVKEQAIKANLLEADGEIEVLCDTASDIYIPLISKPDFGAISEEDLEKVAAGGDDGYVSTNTIVVTNQMALVDIGTVVELSTFIVTIGFLFF